MILFTYALSLAYTLAVNGLFEQGNALFIALAVKQVGCVSCLIVQMACKIGLGLSRTLEQLL